jgi:hypothetical protein
MDGRQWKKSNFRKINGLALVVLSYNFGRFTALFINMESLSEMRGMMWILNFPLEGL